MHHVVVFVVPIISTINYISRRTRHYNRDAMGNAPTFLLAIDMNLSQFQDFVCQNAFASGAPPRTPLGGLQRPPPQTESFGSGKNEPPPFRNPGYGPDASQECRSNLGGQVCEGISQGGADKRRIPETSRSIRTGKWNAAVG